MQCRQGYGSAEMYNLTCNKKENTWDKPLPDCSSNCSAGYFKTDRECGKAACGKCITDTCPVGQFRAHCLPSVGAACTLCTRKPPHSHFIGGGDPYDSDSCPWKCDKDYVWTTAENTSASIAGKCQFVGGQGVLEDDPIDSDGDSIPDEAETRDIDTDGVCLCFVLCMCMYVCVCHRTAL